MTVNVGHLFRKRVVRRLNGEIIDWTDETDGGSIISKGRIVNQEKIDQEAKKEQDRLTAASAITQQTEQPHLAEERTQAPSKMQELEQRIEAQDAKLDKILEALSKK
jgi:hypothetical protein